MDAHIMDDGSFERRGYERGLQEPVLPHTSRRYERGHQEPVLPYAIPLNEEEDPFGGLEDLQDLPDLNDLPEPPAPEPFDPAAPWGAMGLKERPSWWHYWEERNLPPPLPPVESPSRPDTPVPEGPVDFDPPRAPSPRPPPSSPERDEPRPPERELPGSPERDEISEEESPHLPAEGADSPTWAAYWETRSRRQARFYLASAQREIPAAPPREDFAAPPLRDGAWNRSQHVRTLITKGFSISVNENMRGKAPPSLICHSDHERDYIAQMVADGVIEEGPARFCVPHFFLYKTGKVRLIFDGRKLNSAVAQPPRFNMKSHKTIASLAASNDWHAADDLKNMFFSIAISEQSRPFFGLRVEGKTYVYRKLPFGFSWSPFIAHIAVDEIAKRAIEKGFKVTHYLDDFHYFGSSRAEVEEARDFVRGLFMQAGWRINLKKEDPPKQRFEALGVEYDLLGKRSRILERMKEQLRAAHESYNGKRISRRTLAAMVGLLAFFNNAVPGILSQWGQLIEILQQAGTNWKKSYRYDGLKPYIDSALSSLSLTGWAALQFFKNKPLELYTDATPTQVGAVLVDQGKVLAVDAKRIKRKQIYRAEADAIHWIASKWSKTDLAPLIKRGLLIHCDNMALVNAVKKGRSNIYEANRLCQDLLELRLRGVAVKIKHVPTLENLADAPSRLAPGSVTVQSGALCFAPRLPRE